MKVVRRLVLVFSLSAISSGCLTTNLDQFAVVGSSTTSSTDETTVDCTLASANLANSDLTVTGSVTVAVGTTTTLQFDLRDDSNTSITDTDYSSCITFSPDLGSSDDFGTVTSAGSGLYDVTYTASTSGTVNITALFNSESLTSAIPTVTAFDAKYPVISTQPSSTATAGTSFAQQPIVHVYDTSTGALDASATNTIYSAAYSDSTCTTLASGTYGGTSLLAAGSGVADFSPNSLSYTKAETIYLLFTINETVPAPYTRTVCSSGITVSAGAYADLAFSGSYDSAVSAGSSFTTKPTVQAVDSFGNAVSQSGLSLEVQTYDTSCSTHQNLVTLANSTATTNALGIAEFTNLTISSTGSYQLRVYDTVTPANFDCGNTLTVSVGAPAQLSFLSTPSTATAGSTLSPLIVDVQDAGGNNVSTATDSVTLSVYTTSDCSTTAGSGTFNHPGAVNASSGLVNFTGGNASNYEKAEIIYLKASATGLTSACSGAITVDPATPTQIILTSAMTSPTPVNSTPTQKPEFEYQDSFGNKATQVTGVPSLFTSWNDTAGCGGSVAGSHTGSPAVAAGTLTYSDFQATLTGSHYIKLSDTTYSINACFGPITISAGAPDHLSITTTPPTSIASYKTTFSLTVEVQDASNNTMDSSDDGRTLEVQLFDDSACSLQTTVIGTYTGNTGSTSSGSLGFSVEYTHPGTFYVGVLDTSGTPLSPVCHTSAITIGQPALSTIAFTNVSSTTPTAGASVSFDVEMRDSDGDPINGYTGQVTVSFIHSQSPNYLDAPDGTGGTFDPVSYVFTASENGVLSFSGLNDVEFYTQGTWTVRAHDDEPTNLGDFDQGISVSPAAPKYLMVLFPGQTVNEGDTDESTAISSANDQGTGLKFNYTVQSFDNYYNKTTGYTGTFDLRLFGEHIEYIGGSAASTISTGGNVTGSMIGWLYYPWVKILPTNISGGLIAVENPHPPVLDNTCSPTVFTPPSKSNPHFWGEGTSEEPYLICDGTDLAALDGAFGNSDFSGLSFRQMAYISLSGAFNPIGFMSGQSFEGSYDGFNNAIQGLDISAMGGSTNIGLFKTIGSSGSVQDLTLILGGPVVGNNTVGALAGTNNGSISNVQLNVNGYEVRSTITTPTPKSTVGGLVGVNAGTILRGMTFDSYLDSSPGGPRGGTDVGGIAGRNEGTISESVAAVAVGTPTGFPFASSQRFGGMVGFMNGPAASLSKSVTFGKLVSGISPMVIGVGGLVGGMLGGGTISESLSNITLDRSDIGGGTNVGGLVGTVSGVTTLSESYAINRYSGSNGTIYGIFGMPGPGAFGCSSSVPCYFSNETTASDNGTDTYPLSYSQLFVASNLTGFDISSAGNTTWSAPSTLSTRRASPNLNWFMEFDSTLHFNAASAGTTQYATHTDIRVIPSSGVLEHAGGWGTSPVTALFDSGTSRDLFNFTSEVISIDGISSCSGPHPIALPAGSFTEPNSFFSLLDSIVNSTLSAYGCGSVNFSYGGAGLVNYTTVMAGSSGGSHILDFQTSSTAESLGFFSTTTVTPSSNTQPLQNRSYDRAKFIENTNSNSQYYFELEVNYGKDLVVGFTAPDHLNNRYPGEVSGDKSIGYRSGTGEIYVNGSVVETLNTWDVDLSDTPAVIGVLLDSTGSQHSIAFEIMDESGNNIATSSFHSLPNNTIWEVPIAPAVSAINSNGSSQTEAFHMVLNIGQSSFKRSAGIPSGYREYWRPDAD